MLKLIDIHKTFNPGTINEKVALNGVDLHLNEGDFVTVIGGNGAGKSTMLNAVAGAWPVDSGKIIIGGTDVTKLSEYKRAAYLGRVFQDPMTGTGASGDTELFEKASNINGFQGGRVANNLYISPFRATVFKTAALFLYLNSSVVIRVRKPLFFPL